MKKIIITFIIVILIIITILLGMLGFKKNNTNKDIVNIRMAEVTHSAFYAPLYVAIEEGYFKEEGIELEVILTPGADKVSAAVLSNTVDIGFSGPEAAFYIYDGGEEDYLITFAGLTKRDGQFIVSRSCDNEFILEDLYGKEILVGRNGGMPSLNFINAMKNNNIDIEKININYAIDFANLSGAFMSGVGDYVDLFEPTATAIVSTGDYCIVESIGKLSGEVPYTAFYARSSYLNKNKDILTLFTKAINKGLKYVQENDALTIAKVIQPQFPDSSLNDLESIINNYKKYDSWYQNSYIDKNSFDNLVDILNDNNLIKNNMPYHKLIHNLYEK